MKHRRTLIIEDSSYKQITEIAENSNTTISNIVESALRDYIRKADSGDTFSNVMIPMDKRIDKLEENLLDILFKLRFEVGIIVNLLLPLSTNYITRTDKDILRKVMDEVEGIYESARKKTVRQLERRGD